MGNDLERIPLDENDRLMLPESLLKHIHRRDPQKVAITYNPIQSCYLLCTLDAWNLIGREIARLDAKIEANRLLQRIVLGYAHELSIDQLGGVSLSSFLKERGTDLEDYPLSQPALLIEKHKSQRGCFLLWDPETYRQRQRNRDSA